MDLLQKYQTINLVILLQIILMKQESTHLRLPGVGKYISFGENWFVYKNGAWKHYTEKPIEGFTFTVQEGTGTFQVGWNMTLNTLPTLGNFNEALPLGNYSIMIDEVEKNVPFYITTDGKLQIFIEEAILGQDASDVVITIPAQEFHHGYELTEDYNMTNKNGTWLPYCVAELENDVLSITGTEVVTAAHLAGIDLASAKEIRLEAGVKGAAAQTFVGLTALETVYYANTVNYIADNAFVDCAEGVVLRAIKDKEYTGGLVNPDIHPYYSFKCLTLGSSYGEDTNTYDYLDYLKGESGVTSGYAYYMKCSDSDSGVYINDTKTTMGNTTNMAWNYDYGLWIHQAWLGVTAIQENDVIHVKGFFHTSAAIDGYVRYFYVDESYVCAKYGTYVSRGIGINAICHSKNKKTKDTDRHKGYSDVGCFRYVTHIESVENDITSRPMGEQYVLIDNQEVYVVNLVENVQVVVLQDQNDEIISMKKGDVVEVTSKIQGMDTFNAKSFSCLLHDITQDSNSEIHDGSNLRKLE